MSVTDASKNHLEITQVLFFMNIASAEKRVDLSAAQLSAKNLFIFQLIQVVKFFNDRLITILKSLRNWYVGSETTHFIEQSSTTLNIFKLAILNAKKSEVELWRN